MSGASGNVDWQLTSNTTHILLEAKFRYSDWARLTDGQTFNYTQAGFLADAGHKFTKENNYLKVVGTTLYSDVDENILRHVYSELQTYPQIDAVILHTLGNTITIAALTPQTVKDISHLLHQPRGNTYPLYSVFFGLKERAQRVTTQPLTTIAGKLPYRQTLKPVGGFAFKHSNDSYRANITGYGVNGEPQIQIIPFSEWK